MIEWMYPYVCYLWPLCLYHIFPHYLINGITSWKTVLNTTGLLWFSLQFLPKEFLILKGAKRDDVHVRRSSCEMPIIPVKFNRTCILSTDFRKVINYQLPYRSNQWESNYSMRTENKTDIQTDIRDEANSRFSQFYKRTYEWTIFMTARAWNSFSAALKSNSKRRYVGLNLKVSYPNETLYMGPVLQRY